LMPSRLGGIPLLPTMHEFVLTRLGSVKVGSVGVAVDVVVVVVTAPVTGSVELVVVVVMPVAGSVELVVVVVTPVVGSVEVVVVVVTPVVGSVVVVVVLVVGSVVPVGAVASWRPRQASVNPVAIRPFSVSSSAGSCMRTNFEPIVAAGRPLPHAAHSASSAAVIRL